MKSSLSVLLSTIALASVVTLAQGSVDGFDELMDMASSPAATAGICVRSTLERDLSSVDSEWEKSGALGCKGVEASIAKAKAVSEKLRKCGGADMGVRIQRLISAFAQLKAERCDGSQDAMSQILGVSAAVLQIKVHRDAIREKREANERRRARASRLMNNGVDPSRLPLNSGSLRDWDSLTTATFAGEPFVQVCVRDHECEDGDILNVWVNGEPAIAEELLNVASCSISPVKLGANKVQVYAPNGTGYKGHCDFSDVNTGEISISGLDELGNPVGATTQSWSLNSKAGSSTNLNIMIGLEAKVTVAHVDNLQSSARAEHAQRLRGLGNGKMQSGQVISTKGVTTHGVPPEGYGQTTTASIEPTSPVEPSQPITQHALSSEALNCMRQQNKMLQQRNITSGNYIGGCDNTTSQSHQVKPLPPKLTPAPTPSRPMRTPVSPHVPTTMQPSPEKFGALAIDSNQGKAYGWAVNFSSPGQAEQYALSECSRNGRNCFIVLRFGRSTCAAYSVDHDQNSTAYGWGKTDNLGQAQNLANSNCQSRGGRTCVNRVWGCNSP